MEPRFILLWANRWTLFPHQPRVVTSALVAQIHEILISSPRSAWSSWPTGSTSASAHCIASPIAESDRCSKFIVVEIYLVNYVDPEEEVLDSKR